MPSSDAGRFLLFSGLLLETMVFQHLPGWETGLVRGRRDREGDGTFVLELLSDRGRSLVLASPRIAFREPCGSRDGVRSAHVLTFIALHPDAREIVFRRGDQALYRGTVAARPPRLRIAKPVRMGRDRFRVSWRASHLAPLSFELLYSPDGRTSFALGSAGQENEFAADLRKLPGSARGRLGVMATDGVRSATSWSGPIRVEEKPPRVWIHAPSDGETLPADHVISLNGQATDAGGTSLPDDGLQWVVDGTVIAEGARLAVSPALEPGPHRIVLRYQRGGNDAAERRIRVLIANRSAEQERYLRILREVTPGGPPPPFS